jgi:RNA polymerase sigma-70 factor (ECF subfamily)
VALEPDLRDQLLVSLSPLRAFAISLLRDRDRADDLVHETVVRALSKLDRFERGTDFRAWLFTILRNLFYSDARRRGREVSDSDGAHAARLTIVPEQMGHLAFQDLQAALQKLPPKQREVLILVGAQGLSYEEAATVCGCAVGTIKSRLCRARELLATLMGETNPEEIGRDSVTLAVLSKAA